MTYEYISYRILVGLVAIAVLFLTTAANETPQQLYFNIIVEPHARLKRAYYNGAVIDRKQLQQ